MKVTLATLPLATSQQVFDQVAVHLLLQRQRSLASQDMCAYRGEDGLKCAAGCLIGDDEYQSWMDDCVELTASLHDSGELDSNELIWTTAWGVLVGRGLVPAAHADLILRLQRVHDHMSVNSWRIELEHLANEFELATDVLGAFE